MVSFAAALPVWLLLAPRDYLSTYLKIGTIGALALGIIIVMPEIQMPAVTPYIWGGGPVLKGSVFLISSLLSHVVRYLVSILLSQHRYNT